MTDQSLPQSQALTPFSSPSPSQSPSWNLHRLMRNAANSLAHFFRRRRDRAHLAELPAYLLDDIGLTPADVDRLPPTGETWR